MGSGRGEWLGIALVAAAILRFAGLTYGLPHVFNADEPHIVNLAVSFGKGSLNPYSFKYPTLWPTALFLFFGVYFLAWSGFGLKASLGQFTALFAWDPTGFYVIARGLAALLSLLGAAILWRVERENLAGVNSTGIPWAALLLAFAPDLTVAAHAAKPDAAMFFFSCAAWYFGLRLYREGSRRWSWACGACLGLGFSCQYTLLPIMSLLPLAYFLGSRRGPWRWLAEGAMAAAAGFLAGSPYVLLDFPKFRASLGDFSYLAGAAEVDQWRVAVTVLGNIWSFAGWGGVAGLAALGGLWSLGRRERKLAVVLAVPVALSFVFFASHPDGGWMRYLFGCFPALALLAGRGLESFCAEMGKRFWRRAVPALAAVVAIAPGVYGSWRFDAEVLLPDTRTLSKAWIESHIPEGETFLMDSPHAGPLLLLTREHLETLRAQTERAGSPRSRLYAVMAQRHPGGGYRVYRVQRSALDLRSNPKHVAQSQADQAMLDLRGGLSAARDAGVRYVVVSSHGAQPGRAGELKLFFDELCTQGRLLREFVPEPGLTTGPLLRVYRI